MERAPEGAPASDGGSAAAEWRSCRKQHPRLMPARAVGEWSLAIVKQGEREPLCGTRLTKCRPSFEVMSASPGVGPAAMAAHSIGFYRCCARGERGGSRCQTTYVSSSLEKATTFAAICTSLASRAGLRRGPRYCCCGRGEIVGLPRVTQTARDTCGGSTTWRFRMPNGRSP